MVGFIPPVGINFTLGKGAETAFKYFTPPEISAGNNFRISQPKFIALVISVGVKTPGTHKIFFFLQKLGSIEDFDVKITIKYQYRGYVSVRHPYLLMVLYTCCDLQVITTNLRVVIEI